MYRRQKVVAGASGAAGGGYALHTGYPLFHAALLAVAGFVIVRWGLATVGRTNYWLHRGSRGAHARRCPNCNRQRWRVGGDWILHCYQCGWQPGLPGIRLLTQNVAIRQAMRSLSPARVLVVALCIGIVAVGWQPALAGVVGSGLTPLDQEGGSPASTRAPTASPSPPKTDSPDSGLNETRVERLIWKYTNEERTARGLSKLEYSAKMASPAERHSENMARHDYVGHTRPNGQTMEERYASVCAYPGENANKAHYLREFEAYKSGKIVYLDNESEVAHYMVDSWMRSSGHRENILRDEYRKIGVGIAVSSSGEVYATQGFCASYG